MSSAPAEGNQDLDPRRIRQQLRLETRDHQKAKMPGGGRAPGYSFKELELRILGTGENGRRGKVLTDLTMGEREKKKGVRLQGRGIPNLGLRGGGS